MDVPLTFDQWMSNVDTLLENRVGLDSGSLEDWNWFDDYDSGLSAHEAVDDWLAENLIAPTLQ
jgi:hypothetical protein